SADQIAPTNGAFRKQEAPVGTLAASLGSGALISCQVQHGALVHRWPPAADPHLTLGAQLLFALETRIEPPCPLQPFGSGFVPPQPIRLLQRLVPADTKPAQVILNCFGKFETGTLTIGIVETQQELPAAMAREQEVRQRDPRV